ncbi:MAG: glycosyltransferase [Candidatus Buchananbacteria bacterium]
MKVLIVLPVYNEELILKQNVQKLLAFCRNFIIDDWQIVIADNLSNDQTAAIGQDLAQTEAKVLYLFVNKKGKGAAIRAGWKSAPADIYCFMDADLATDLAALPKLIEAIKNGYDLALGSRYDQQSKVKRSFGRKFFSRGYHLILNLFLGLKIKDAPCGFKAVNQKVIDNILPQVENQAWFFDSELVILAESGGYKIKEFPVVWEDIREGRDKSRVQVISLSLVYLKEIAKLKFRLKRK